MRQKVAEAEPYPILKIKMGFDGDLEALEAIRRATDKPIRVDANEGWSRREALARIPALEDLGVTVVYGHTPRADFEVRWNLPYSIGIDTGAVYGGRLTALRLPDERLFQA